tara:strand:- start:2931 stop:4118 length:1188 start_codon:yes stop_codon:yes gene_type:complete
VILLVSSTYLSSVSVAKTLLEPPPFADWLKALMVDADARGVSQATIQLVLANSVPINRVIELDRRQPEFTMTLFSYFKKAISQQRILKGKKLLETHASLLRQVEKKYGVQPRFLVAFWGLESNFGQFTGSFSVVQALVTLAHDRRRAKFFREQLFAVLDLIDAGHIPPNVMGSWAGAMGNHQFIPTTYKGYAVDFDGDGKRDLWNSLPDIFASAANYLSRSGWQDNKTWGREVKIPSNFDLNHTGMKIQKPLNVWNKLGVRLTNGEPLPRATFSASLIIPAGYQGPAFLVYKNYRTIMIWNRSHLYALAVGHLADRLTGKGPLVKRSSNDDVALSRADIREMQALLNQRGFHVGTPDGVTGPMTRSAIRAFQRSRGMPPDGYPNKSLVVQLRNAQ